MQMWSCALCVYKARISGRTRAVRNAYAAADENISRFETIIGFPFNRILFHSFSAYRTIETCPITDTFLRPHIETYCRRYVAAAEIEYYAHQVWRTPDIKRSRKYLAHW